jgi:hypothetical protein
MLDRLPLVLVLRVGAQFVVDARNETSGEHVLSCCSEL